MAGLTAGLQSALGHYLAASANGPELLGRVAGRVIAVQLRPSGATLYLCPTDRDVLLLTEINGEADVTIAGSPQALIGMGLGGKESRLPSGGSIEVIGDTDVARRVQALFRELDIDWIALLARHTGPAIARKLGGLAHAGNGWIQDTARALRADLTEFLQEEALVLPTSDETDGFLTLVDTLRADHDRLSLRIARLEQSLMPALTPPSQIP
jgi:ubiquinone biosynthesis protein UbiJ